MKMKFPEKKFPKKWSILVTIIIVATISIIIKKTYLSNSNKELFITATVDRGDIQQGVSASGTLNPVKLINIGTQISGVVKAIHVDFNDTVTEGQILAELDQSLLQTQLVQSQGNLASAKATLKLASTNYKRAKELFAKDYVPRADLEKAEQELETAGAQVATAIGQIDRDKVNLGYTVIRSPVSGVIISRDVNIGQTVAASFQTPTLFKIAQDLKKMQIDTNLSEADVGAVKEGQPVHFTVDAYPGRKFTGSVRQIRLNSTTVQNVVTYNVVINVDNSDLTLLPGMTAFATLVEAEHKDILRIPNSALSFKLPEKISKYPVKNKAENNPTEKNMNKIYVLNGNKPLKINVKIGISDGKFTEILAGELKEGDTVITAEASLRKGSNNSGKSPAGGMRMF